MLDSHIDDKENMPMMDTNTLNGYSAGGLNFLQNFSNGQPQMTLQQAMLNKKAKNKSSAKAQKSLNNSVRAGDWICLVCNNLNFSFRNECNRCQMQTKKQNYIQNLLLISEKKGPAEFKNSESMTQARQALKDLTNLSIEEDQQSHRNHVPKVFSQSYFSDGDSPELKSSSNGLPPGLGGMMGSQTKTTNPSTTSKETNPNSKFDDFEFSPNYGFENAVLLTPPRFNHQANDYSSPVMSLTDSNKLLLPYQSPKQLPSVSPILRKVLSYGEHAANSEEFHNTKYLKYRTALQRSNSQSNEHHGTSSKETPKCSVKHCHSNFRQTNHTHNHSFDDTAVDNFNFEEINKCIQETISIEGGSGHNMNSVAFLDFAGFNNVLMKENINPALLGVEKSYNVLFAGINMNDDNNTSNSANNSNSKNQPKKERKADWICQWCNNLNYSFRKACNRCQVARTSA